jgi:hypothetical protein
MAGYVRNDTLNNIANGNVINAADLDGEFDAIVAAFHASTGHVHDGTAANGAPITKLGPSQEFIGSSSDFSPKTDNTYDLGSATFEFKDAYIDGTAYIDAIDLNGTAITATGTEINYLSGVTSAIQTQFGNKQPLDAELTAIAGLTSAADKVPYFTGSGTAAVADFTSFGRSLVDDANSSAARTTLGLVIGTDVQAYDPQLADVAGLTPTDGNFIVGDGTNFVTESGSTARTSLGLGSIATQDASNVTITGGSITGITDLAVADGGTGASTAANARVNLLPSYTGNANRVLSINSGGTDVEWSTPVSGTGDVVGPSSAVNNRFAAFDGITGKLIKDSTYTSSSFEPADATILKSAAIGVTVQGYDAQLADVAGLAVTDGNFIVGNGTNFVAESGATARTSLGLGTGDSPEFTAVNIGNATDTTITRSSAGVIAVEGSNVLMASNIGSTVQAYDAQLADVAGLTPTDNGVIIGNGTNFVVESGATLKTSLGLTIGTDVQAYDPQLADIAGLTPTDNGVIIGDGTNFVVESGATLKTSLGLTIGTDVQAYDSNLTSFVNTFTLPTTDGTSGQVLQTNGTGTLSFATPSSGGVTTGKAIAMALIFGF